ncbi:hypothetical protein GW17_00042748 [Ensete ventricosum]|nr:hypothetical protein GW17_00042748 [Ensete ventricosum]
MLEWVKRRRIKRILYLMRREILNVLCLLLPRSTAWYALVYPSVCYTIPYRAKLGTLACHSHMQITFVPEEPPPLEYSRMLKLPGVTYNLYSKSIHQAGQVTRDGNQPVIVDYAQDLAWESLTELRNSSIVPTGELPKIISSST